MKKEILQKRTGDIVTQMHFAKQSILTAEMQHVAETENLSPEKVMKDLASGRLIIPSNIKHLNLRARGIGRTLKCKINANIGNSPVSSGHKEELDKLAVCIELDTDAVMDLSTGPNIVEIRKSIIENSPLPVGTVPIYEALEKVDSVEDISADLLLEVIESHAEQGVDFVTVHCGILREHLLDAKNRLAGIVSRGGAILAQWMISHRRQNPLYERYDDILAICRKYDLALSLGDGLRPGCIADASDKAQFAELDTLGELVTRAREASVQAMVEGPGHIPLNEVAMNMQREREVCDDAPFYILGPVVTDIAPGYDHISSSIGAALGAFSGASMLCYVTPREHLGLPTLEDVRQGIVAYKIAAHAADIALGRPGARQRDDEISRARVAFDWDRIFSLSLDPVTARKMWDESTPEECDKDLDYCSMCGPKFCAMKLSRALEKLGPDYFGVDKDKR